MVLFSYLRWFFFYSFYGRHIDILRVTCVFERILICLCNLFLTCIHPSNSSTHSILGDLHPFEESYHLGFVNDLHLSKGILSLSHFYVIFIQLKNLITQVSLVIYICLREFYHVRLNLINHFVGFIPYQFSCNSALRNPVFRW